MAATSFYDACRESFGFIGCGRYGPDERGQRLPWGNDPLCYLTCAGIPR